MPVHALACLTAAVLSAAVVTLAVPPLGALGEWSLTHPSLTGFWQRVDSLPLLPWLGLHNTVIHGAFLVGLFAAIPSAFASLFLTRWVIDEADEASQAHALFEITEESFVELSPEEISQLDKLGSEPAPSVADGAASASDASVLLNDENLRLDVAAEGVAQPNFPVRTFEVDSLDDVHPELSQQSDDHRDRLQTSAFEVPDFQLVEPESELAEGPSKPIEPPKTNKRSPSIYSFDAVARLEELLSGCRVQPHWANENSEDDRDTDDSALEGKDAEREDGAILRVDQQHVHHYDDSAQQSDDDNVPSSGEILERSHEIAGLVDQLIATLNDEEDAQPVSELRFDAAHETSKTAQPSSPGVHDDAAQASDAPSQPSRPSDEIVRDESTGLQLRFDQIDISEQFARPLYQPHSTSGSDDLKVSIRGRGDSLSREELELQIERRDLSSGATETAPARPAIRRSVVASPATEPASAAESARQEEPQPSSEPIAAGESQPAVEKKSNESLIHLVQRGHDEALRHLLHHLREIEERVRE
ncbi:MAG: hypothetical protein Aurels2KO_44500 [Aureliella sp.]